MACTGRDPRTLTQMSRLLGGLRYTRDWCRDVAVNRDAAADTAGDLVHSIVVIPYSTTYASL